MWYDGILGGHLGCRQAMVNQGGRGLVQVPVGPTRVWYQVLHKSIISHIYIFHTALTITYI